MIDIKVPTVGESISEVTLVKWLKKDGDYVDRDEMIAELEIFNPMDKDAQQWSNIHMARIVFKQVKRNQEASLKA